jgi:hypothetical protein
MQRVLVLRTEPDNREAIDFALDQLLSSPADALKVVPPKSFESVGLGAEADNLIVRLDQALLSESPRALESAIADAIKKSGTDVVVESPEPDRGVDLAVWSDVLEPFVGNPFLIEIKLRIKDRKAADGMLKRLNSVLGASSTRWALLIYGDGPGPEEKFWRNCPPNILILPARALLTALRGRAFPEVVRDLRNRRVHSVRP